MDKAVTGVILAGGKSRRMGSDKAKLKLGAVTFLQRAKTILSDAGCKNILISSPEFIADKTPGGGPLSGLHAICSDLPLAAVLLVIPVDMPHLQTNLLRSLIAKNTGGAGSHFAKQPLPFVIKVSRDLREYLNVTLSEPNADRSLMAMFRALDLQKIAINADWQDQFWNCNTPGNYDELRAKS